MNNEVVLPADAVKKEEPKAAVPKATMASKPKPAAKKARKAVKKAQQKTKKPAAKKLVQRRAFPYQQVLKMWKAGKTLEKIARAVGRFQKDADDPLRAFIATMPLETMAIDCRDNYRAGSTSIGASAAQFSIGDLQYRADPLQRVRAGEGFISQKRFEEVPSGVRTTAG
jgi:hypothetical protein